MTTVFQDLRYGARMLLRRPGLTVIAFLTLALGIGANTTVFSLADAWLLRPLPFNEPERLVAIWESELKNPGVPAIFASYRDYQEWEHLQATRLDVNAMLKENVRGGSPGIRPQRARRLLIVAEVALSLLLLAGGGLMTRSFAQLKGEPLGFRTDEIVALGINLPRNL